MEPPRLTSRNEYVVEFGYHVRVFDELMTPAYQVFVEPHTGSGPLATCFLHEIVNSCGVIAGPESQSSSARQPGRLPLIEARSTWSKLPITPLPSPYAPFPLTSAMYALIERPQIDPLSHHES